MKLKIVLALLLLCGITLYGALPVGVVWEIESGGSDSNGGGFVTGASGTDRSQSTSAFCSATDLVLVTTTTATSVTCPFGSTSVGNLIQITAGTNCTVGFYQVVSVATVTATLDRVAGTTGCTAGTFALGGALALPNKPCSSLTSGNTIYVKAATFTVTTSCSLGSSTSANTSTSFIGYTTTRGDGGKATWTTATNSNPLIIHTGQIWGLNIVNFTFTNTATTRSTGIANSGNQTMNGLVTENCVFDGFTNAINERQPANVFLYNTEVKNSTVGGVVLGSANVGTSGGVLYNTWIHDNTGIGVALGVANGMLTIMRSTIANNTTDGVQIQAQTSETANQVVQIVNSNLTGNGSDGIESTNNGIEINIAIINSIIYGNTSFGVKMGITPSYQLSLNNAFGSNGTDRSNFTAGAGDITLTATPFVASGSGNYALNNNSGGGALLRGKGSIGSSLFGTGYPDVGPIQHRDPKFKIGF